MIASTCFLLISVVVEAAGNASYLRNKKEEKINKGMLDVLVNRLHASSPSLSLRSWLFSSASQTVRKSLKVSARMRMERTGHILTKGEKPRYEILLFSCAILKKCNTAAKAPG